jgi:hypothetical protein
VWGFSGPQYAAVLFDPVAKLMWWTQEDGVTFEDGTGTTYSAAQVASGTVGFNFSTYLTAGAVFGVVGAQNNPGHQFSTATLPGGWTMPSGFSLL